MRKPLAGKPHVKKQFAEKPLNPSVMYCSHEHRVVPWYVDVLKQALFEDTDKCTKQYGMGLTRDVAAIEEVNIFQVPDDIPQLQYITDKFNLVDTKPEVYIGTLKEGTATVLTRCRKQFGKLSKTLPKGSKIEFKEEL